MNCPKCTVVITKPGTFCAGCGHDFGEGFAERLAFYFDLKEETRALQRCPEEPSIPDLPNLSLKVQKYEAMLGQELAQSEPSAPVMRQTMAQAPEVKHAPVTAAPVRLRRTLTGAPPGRGIRCSCAEKKLVRVRGPGRPEVAFGDRHPHHGVRDRILPEIFL